MQEKPIALVTGATGFIGRHLVERLLHEGWQVRMFVRSILKATTLSFPGARIIVGDLLDPVSVQNAVSGAEYIFHVAGNTATSGSFLINSKGTQHIVDAIRHSDAQCKRFIHISSLSVSGPGLDREPIIESFFRGPKTDYAKSKWRSEQIALSIASRIPTVVIRPPAVYGPYDTELLPIFRMMAKRVCCIPGSRDDLLSVVHVDNLIDGIMLAAVLPSAIGNTFLIADNPPLTKIQLFEKIADAMSRRPLLTLSVPRVAARFAWPLMPIFRARAQAFQSLFERNWSCSIQHASSALGYAPRIQTDEGLRQTVAWYHTNSWL